MKPSLLKSALLLALLFAAGCNYTGHPPLVGVAAPDFIITDPAHSVHLAAYRGQVVLVNFWASWCEPCVEEWPGLVTLQKQMPQITILAIDIDDSPADYSTFLDTHATGLLTVRDATGHSADLYGTHQFPETFVVDRNGIIRRKFIGAQDWTTPEIIDFLSKQ
jgi:thiol-disulfide isomerase/thioredoxin